MKKIFTHLLGLILAVIFANTLSAQTKSDLVCKWEYNAVKVNDSIFDIVGKMTITNPAYHVWTLNPGTSQEVKDFAVPTKITVKKSKDIKLIGKIKANGKVKSKDDEMFGKINTYENSVTYTQRIQVLKNNITVTGETVMQACDATTCLPPAYEDFSLKITTANPPDPNAVVPDSLNSTIVNTDTLSTSDTTSDSEVIDTDSSIVLNASNSSPTSNKAEDVTSSDELEEKSLLELFVAGLLAGFVAFIMPCIYAMLPVTVSFFTKRSKDRKTGIKNAIIYSLSIIFIFALIGALISISFTPKTMYEISTSMWFNLFVFIIFIVFGVSLLGAFEITLPSSWANKLDKKANANSVSGIFFMALVLVVVSFSCTSAFISTLVVYIINSGNSLGGIVGFLGFGLAIALPFAMGALFPGMINNMAKSGGWLNAVKVTMGFLELALALKFLSNVDMMYHWHILDTEVFLSLWIIIFGLLGLYLLGKLRLPHDEELPKNHFGVPHIGVVRLLFAIGILSFTVYLVPGLWGAPLRAVSGFLPKRTTLDFNLHDKLIEIQQGASGTTVEPKKYTDKLGSELPGIKAFFDYHEALEASKATGKPILLDFTGHSCINCRKMERAVLSKPEVLAELSQHFIVASLYVDDTTPLPADEIYKSAYDGKEINTLGAKNFDIEYTKYKSVAQPLYVFIDAQENIIMDAGGYVNDVPRFMNIIKQVKEKYAASHPAK